MTLNRILSTGVYSNVNMNKNFIIIANFKAYQIYLELQLKHIVLLVIIFNKM